MTKVVGIDGKPIKQSRSKSLADRVVTQVLKRAAKRNTNGEIAAIVLITVSPDGIPTQMFHWGDAHDGAFTCMIGSLEIAKQSLIGHAIASAEVEEIEADDS